jgi:hypothetical protein
MFKNLGFEPVFVYIWSPGIDSEESTPPGYVVWRAGTTNRVAVPARQAGIDSWLLKRFTNTVSVPVTTGSCDFTVLIVDCAESGLLQLYCWELIFIMRSRI